MDVFVRLSVSFQSCRRCKTAQYSEISKLANAKLSNQSLLQRYHMLKWLCYLCLSDQQSGREYVCEHVGIHLSNGYSSLGLSSAFSTINVYHLRVGYRQKNMIVSTSSLSHNLTIQCAFSNAAAPRDCCSSLTTSRNTRGSVRPKILLGFGRSLPDSYLKV